MNNKKSFCFDNLEEKDVQLILESLLYTSSVDVCGNFTQEFCKHFYEIALKIRNKYPEILTENLEIISSDQIPFEDEITHKIVKIFPEIRKEEIL